VKKNREECQGGPERKKKSLRTSSHEKRNAREGPSSNLIRKKERFLEKGGINSKNRAKKNNPENVQERLDHARRIPKRTFGIRKKR